MLFIAFCTFIQKYIYFFIGAVGCWVQFFFVAFVGGIVFFVLLSCKVLIKFSF